MDIYLRELNLEQKKVMFAFCKDIAEADKKGIDIYEKNLLELYQEEMGLTSDESEEFSIDQLSVFDTPRAQRIFLLEAMGVALADHEFAPEEQEIIKKVADQFGISAAVLDKITSLLTNQVALLQDINALVVDGIKN